jgi:hypothetical protein
VDYWGCRGLLEFVEKDGGFVGLVEAEIAEFGLVVGFVEEPGFWELLGFSLLFRLLLLLFGLLLLLFRF